MKNFFKKLFTIASVTAIIAICCYLLVLMPLSNMLFESHEVAFVLGQFAIALSSIGIGFYILWHSIFPAILSLIALEIMQKLKILPQVKSKFIMLGVALGIIGAIITSDGMLVYFCIIVGALSGPICAYLLYPYYFPEKENN